MSKARVREADGAEFRVKFTGVRITARPFLRGIGFQPVENLLLPAKGSTQKATLEAYPTCDLRIASLAFNPAAARM